ncbi:MAG: hypothetical protein ACREIF_16100 [Chthoniobacterales bacterium]
MELPPDVEFHQNPRLMVWRPRGLLSESVINRLIKFMGDEEAASHKPFHRLADTLAVDEVDLNFRYIFHVSLFRRLSYSGHPPVKTALLVAENTVAHYARLHAVLTQGSPLKVKIFEDREEATTWLEVPAELIAPR